MPFSALFLDRDGVINVRIPGGYVSHPADFQWMPGNPEAIAKLQPFFNYLIIVTNQQGVGKQIMSSTDLEAVHAHMKTGLSAIGVRLDAIYACTDLKSQPDNCRKPSPKMGYMAQSDFPEIDFTQSVMVGDALSDLQFGQALGMQNVWVAGKAEDEGPIKEAIQHGLPVWKQVNSLEGLLDEIRNI